MLQLPRRPLCFVFFMRKALYVNWYQYNCVHVYWYEMFGRGFLFLVTLRIVPCGTASRHHPLSTSPTRHFMPWPDQALVLFDSEF